MLFSIRKKGKCGSRHSRDQQKGLRCRKCRQRFSNVQKLYAHKKKVHPVKLDRYVCSACYRQYHTASMWQIHIRMCKHMRKKTERFQQLRRQHFPRSEDTSAQWESLTAIDGHARIHTLPVTDEFDLQLTLLKNRHEMEAMLEKDFAVLKRVKWFVVAYIQCQVGEGCPSEPVRKYLRCCSITTLLQENIPEGIEAAIMGVINSYDKTQGEGSAILFQRVEKLELRVAKYSPLKGSSFLPLPKWLRKSSKGLINIKNFNDDKCFLWSCLAGLRLPSHHPERVAWYKHRKNELNMSGMSFPVKVRDVSRFEKQNPTVSVSIFGLEDDTIIVPLRVSPSVKSNHINLLLLQEQDDTSHYVFIKDISRFLGHLTKRKKHLFWCENCLTPRDDRESHEAHRKRCIEQDAQRIKLPSIRDSVMKFQDHASRMKHDYVIYCDLEAVLEPYSTAYPAPNVSSTTRTNRHIPSGYCYVIVCSDGTLMKEPVLEHGDNIIQRLLLALKNEQNSILKRRGPVYPIDMTVESMEKFTEATQCYACHERLPRPGILKVRDHNHSIQFDNYRGAACGPCNLNLKRRNFIPVFLHNLSGYDAHHIISSIGELSNGSDISVIPKTKERYVSFQWGHLRFLDSFGFLSSSLDSLVKDLKPDEMSATNTMFPQIEKRNLVIRKGVYPYSYFDSFEKFEEQQLPPKSAFYNDLKGEELDQKDYDHAVTVWNAFSMDNLWDYHDLYLLTDTLLLCDVMENYRTSSLSQFQLDVVHYYTTPGFAWSAALSYTKQKLELITDLDTHLFFEKAIRGGLSCISGRYAEANNPLIADTYDEQKANSYIMYYDCNALYATAMTRKLPVGGFRFLSEQEIEQFDVLGVSADDEYGYLIECDLQYCENVHDQHNDYPLAPEHLRPQYKNLSNLQKKMIKEYDLPKKCTSKKLVANLYDKFNYCVYSTTLKLYLELGMKVSKIHRILEFHQEAWLAPFVHHNIEMRKNATSDFKKAFFKLLNNATYGKTIESVRKRRNVVLTKEKEKFRKLVKSPLFHSFEIFDHGLVAVERRKATVLLNRPIYTGCVILDIAKEIMYAFHYKVMKVKYGQNINVLATDTDSLIYKVVTPSVYDDMAAMSEHFDTSDYDKSHPLYSIQNRRHLGKFKDEMSGVAIRAFVGLKAKMYSFSRVDDIVKSVGKGIPKAALRSQLTFTDYKSCLEHRNLKMVSFSKISTDQRHHLYQTYSMKRGLSAYDDKRFILKDNKTTLSFGHYRLRNQTSENRQVDDDDDNDDDDDDDGGGEGEDVIGPERSFDVGEAELNLLELIKLMDCV